MKLLALIASAALAIAPVGAIANDAKVAAADASVTTTAPVPGGVAKSSIDFDPEDSELIAAIILAGGLIVIAGTLLAFALDDDGNATVVTTTSTN